MWATMIHPVSRGGWFQQKLGGQEEQIQIQKEAYSGEGEALLFHDGMGLLSLFYASLFYAIEF